jgi:NAD(P)-dependent dehydrogenase (short-subunit alcohol dehydrogenase family)
MKLEGRVALITGGGGGLGRATAVVLAGEGATVIVNDVNQDAAEATAMACREVAPEPNSQALVADVSDSAAVTAMFEEITGRWGRLDVLVNNAGISSLADGAAATTPATPTTEILALSDETWHRMLRVHLDGTFFCTRGAVRLMAGRGTGSIICISSIAGLAGIGPLHYSTAKGGILGFVRSLARQVGPLGIRINAVCPGAIDAGMTKLHDREEVDAYLPMIPLGRLGEAEEIGRAVLYLASDDSSYTTGQWLSPNGGSVIG